MNGYELVRKQAIQDQEISERLPLTGGTLSGGLVIDNRGHQNLPNNYSLVIKSTQDNGSANVNFVNKDDVIMGRVGYDPDYGSVGLTAGSVQLSGGNDSVLAVHLRPTAQAGLGKNIPTQLLFYSNIDRNLVTSAIQAENYEDRQFGGALHFRSARSVFHTNVIPSRDNVYSIGEPTLRFANTYSVLTNTNNIVMPFGNIDGGGGGVMRINTQNMSFVFQNDASSAIPCLRPDGNDIHLGHSAHRWHTIYSINVLNTSDKNFKENIEYISNSKTKDNKITYKDMYDFYKDIEIAKYNYKGQEHQEFGFISQDIANSKVGSEIALDLEGGYAYSVGSYISTVAGALKQSINEIETLKQENQQLKDDIKLIKEKLAI